MCVCGEGKVHRVGVVKDVLSFRMGRARVCVCTRVCARVCVRVLARMLFVVLSGASFVFSLYWRLPTHSHHVLPLTMPFMPPSASGMKPLPPHVPLSPVVSSLKIDEFEYHPLFKRWSDTFTAIPFKPA